MKLRWQFNKDAFKPCNLCSSVSWCFLTGSLSLSPVPVSKPVLSVVGGRLVLGKPFQLRCHSDSGTLPITYTLYGPGGQIDHRIVSRPGKQAVFNTSAIFKMSDLDKFLCHVKNKQNTPPMIESGQQLRRSTVIIGVLNAGTVAPNSVRLM